MKKWVYGGEHCKHLGNRRSWQTVWTLSRRNNVTGNANRDIDKATAGVPLEGRICAEPNPGSALGAISTLMRGSSLERNAYSRSVVDGRALR